MLMTSISITLLICLVPQVVSDVLEALLGGMLTVGGEGLAMSVIERMGLPVPKLMPLSRAREERLISDFQWPWKFELGNPW